VGTQDDDAYVAGTIGRRKRKLGKKKRRKTTRKPRRKTTRKTKRKARKKPKRKPKKMCDEPKSVTGQCRAAKPKWTFDKDSGKCKFFIYGGCGATRNMFRSKKECQRECDRSLKACSCPRIRKPVCGNNGKTYANRCLAKCKRVKKKCNGKCPCKVNPIDCGDFTEPDQIGPFYEERAYLDYKIAPAAELSDKKTATVLAGKILDSHCQGVGGAILDVWYAGKTGNNYTFPPAKLWYRGKTRTKRDGSYKFLATFPVIYKERPIKHYHFKVITPGPRGKELITQAYFESMVPPEFKGYMRGRETQLVPIKHVGKSKDLVNGGRSINFNIILEDKIIH